MSDIMVLNNLYLKRVAPIGGDMAFAVGGGVSISGMNNEIVIVDSNHGEMWLVAYDALKVAYQKSRPTPTQYGKGATAQPPEEKIPFVVETAEGWDMGETIFELVRLVNKQILRGYRPQGGLMVMSAKHEYDQVRFYVSQGMVLERTYSPTNPLNFLLGRQED